MNRTRPYSFDDHPEHRELLGEWARPHHHRGDPVTAATLISPTLAALLTIERDYDHGMTNIRDRYRRQLDTLFAADPDALITEARQHTTTIPPVQGRSLKTPELRWTPTVPDRESLLAGLGQLNGGLIHHDAPDDMTRYMQAEHVAGAAHQARQAPAHHPRDTTSPGLPTRSIRRALDSIARLGRGHA